MDKRLTSLLELIKKTGDRLVVLDGSSDAEPFVIMDLSSYERLIEQQGSITPASSIVSDQDSMREDMELWEKTKQEVESPSVVAESVIAVQDQTPVMSAQNAELPVAESEGTAGDKYYFEEIDDNES
jgi:hypothetical protein